MWGQKYHVIERMRDFSLGAVE